MGRHRSNLCWRAQGWKDHIIRSKDLQHWTESKCTERSPGGCPAARLDFEMPGDDRI